MWMAGLSASDAGFWVTPDQASGIRPRRWRTTWASNRMAARPDPSLRLYGNFKLHWLESEPLNLLAGTRDKTWESPLSLAQGEKTRKWNTQSQAPCQARWLARFKIDVKFSMFSYQNSYLIQSSVKKIVGHNFQSCWMQRFSKNQFAILAGYLMLWWIQTSWLLFCYHSVTVKFLGENTSFLFEHKIWAKYFSY